MLVLIPISVFLTAVLSGVFGMGGGMLLMGVYASLLPVASAMILHGVTQLASNGYRAYLHRRQVHKPVLGWFALGSLTALAVMTALAVTIDRVTLFLFLGGLPLAVALLPRGWTPGIESRPVAVVCGALSTGAQLMGGAPGPLLDIFFVKGGLTRHQVIATKAVMGALGHVTKLVFYGWLVSAGSVQLPQWIFPVVVVMALAGTQVSKRLLDRMSDIRFRMWSTRLVAAIALLFVCRGVAGLL